MKEKGFIIATILAATALSVITTSLTYAQDQSENHARGGDTSQTNREQENNLHGAASGDGEIDNCATNQLETTHSIILCGEDNDLKPLTPMK